MTQDKSKREGIVRALEALQHEYTDELPSKLREIRDFWRTLHVGQWDKSIASSLVHRCHTIAGGAASFGLPQLSEKARVVESFMVSLDLDVRPIGDHMKQIDLAIQALLTAPINGCMEIEAPITAPGNITPLANRPVYIVEDDNEFAKALALQLKNFDYQVEVVSSLDQLEPRFKEKPPGVILMDLVFPEGRLAGADKIKEIKEIKAKQILNVPIIYMSLRDDFEARISSVRSGGDAYFVKPLEIRSLVEKIDDLVTKHRGEPYRALIIDDDALLARHYGQVLEHAGVQVKIITEPTDIISALVEHQPDIVLLDMYMPSCSGIELAHVLRQHDAYQRLPVLFLSGESDVEMQFEARGVGADDYLLKPIQDQHLVLSVVNRAQRARAANEMMFHDSMTGLLSHNRLEEELDRQINLCVRNRDVAAFGMFDLDHFKQVNDQYGHLAGDSVIKSFAQALKCRLRRTDIIGRYGGEEFGVIFPDTDVERAKKIMDGIRMEFESILHIATQKDSVASFKVTVSGGVAMAPEFSNRAALVEAADSALYKAKNNGRNRIDNA